LVSAAIPKEGTIQRRPFPLSLSRTKANKIVTRFHAESAAYCVAPVRAQHDWQLCLPNPAPGLASTIITGTSEYLTERFHSGAIETSLQLLLLIFNSGLVILAKAQIQFEGAVTALCGT
jgi:hypothetical protein